MQYNFSPFFGQAIINGVVVYGELQPSIHWQQALVTCDTAQLPKELLAHAKRTTDEFTFFYVGVDSISPIPMVAIPPEL